MTKDWPLTCFSQNMRKRVLVIEDEPVIAEMISILLEVEGFGVISLADTGLARTKLHANEVDMVMLDLGLKGKEDGQSMCIYIKQQADLKHIPVILVSGNSDLEQIKEQCGADDHIAKPFGVDDFVNKVNRYAAA